MRFIPIGAGYSVSVAENTKQGIWKVQVRVEFDRLQRGLQNGLKSRSHL
jgi:hypothetical protein